MASLNFAPVFSSQVQPAILDIAGGVGSIADTKVGNNSQLFVRPDGVVVQCVFRPRVVIDRVCLPVQQFPPFQPPAANPSCAAVGQTLIGLSLLQAQQRAANFAYIVRVVRRNGNELIVTADFNARRINVATIVSSNGVETVTQFLSCG